MGKVFKKLVRIFDQQRQTNFVAPSSTDFSGIYLLIEKNKHYKNCYAEVLQFYSYLERIDLVNSYDAALMNGTYFSQDFAEKYAQLLGKLETFLFSNTAVLEAWKRLENTFANCIHYGNFIALENQKKAYQHSYDLNKHEALRLFASTKVHVFQTTDLKQKHLGEALKNLIGTVTAEKIKKVLISPAVQTFQNTFHTLRAVSTNAITQSYRAIGFSLNTPAMISKNSKKIFNAKTISASLMLSASHPAAARAVTLPEIQFLTTSEPLFKMADVLSCQKLNQLMKALNDKNEALSTQLMSLSNFKKDDVNTQFVLYDDNTLLHQAVKAGFEKIVWSLLQAGARVEITNKANKKPADLAPPEKKEIIDLYINHTLQYRSNNSPTTVLPLKTRCLTNAPGLTVPQNAVTAGAPTESSYNSPTKKENNRIASLSSTKIPNQDLKVTSSYSQTTKGQIDSQISTAQPQAEATPWPTILGGVVSFSLLSALGFMLYRKLNTPTVKSWITKKTRQDTTSGYEQHPLHSLPEAGSESEENPLLMKMSLLQQTFEESLESLKASLNRVSVDKKNKKSMLNNIQIIERLLIANKFNPTIELFNRYALLLAKVRQSLLQLNDNRLTQPISNSLDLCLEVLKKLKQRYALVNNDYDEIEFCSLNQAKDESSHNHYQNVEELTTPLDRRSDNDEQNLEPASDEEGYVQPRQAPSSPRAESPHTANDNGYSKPRIPPLPYSIPKEMTIENSSVYLAMDKGNKSTDNGYSKPRMPPLPIYSAPNSIPKKISVEKQSVYLAMNMGNKSLHSR